MSGISRRRLLGTAGALGAGTATAYGPPAAAAARGPAGGGGSGGEADRSRATPDPAGAALARLLPDHTEQFTLTLLDAGTDDRFRVTGSQGDIRVAGTTPAAILTGVHWYLKYTCHAHISWAGTRLDLPETLPAPSSPYEQRATVPHRFALNDTHDGYAGAYADWPQWERFLDVLALHGCNEVLVTVGAEGVYHRFLQDFGYSDAEARAWIPAPSHQPWWLLQNLSAYGGPLTPHQLRRRTELGRRITSRLRELGMHPVLPGYFGSVPGDFAERNQGARTVPQGDWHGLERPAWLDPRTPHFRTAAAAYYRHQRELLGDAGHFKMDLLHEGGDPGDVPVADAAHGVEQAMRKAKPDAVWVILGWQNNPRPEILQGISRKNQVLIVDGLSDLEGTSDRESDWNGTPYAFGTIPNFGGRTTLGAKCHMWTDRFAEWRDKKGSALAGTAYMPEAADRDPAAFELFSELAWRREAIDRTDWFREYARVRYGADAARAAQGSGEKALAALRDTAYHLETTDGRPHDSVFSARPDLKARSGSHYATKSPGYDLPAFDAALDALLGLPERVRTTDTYRYDLTDLARQALANRSWTLIAQLDAAYARKDTTAFRELSTLWLRLLQLADETAGAHRGFLLGPWIADASRAAGTAAERTALARTARTLVTTWDGRETADQGSLANYGNRDWHGLLADVHLPQWRDYLDELADALAEERSPKTFDWYAREEKWVNDAPTYPERPVGDAHTLATKVRDALAKAPYQGSVRATSDPRALEPGATGELTAVFRNENGLEPTGRVDFTLTGLDDADPRGPLSFPEVAPAGRAEVTWRLTAPEKLDRPLQPLRYGLRVLYGPRGGKRVEARSEGEVYVAGPLDDGLRTVSTNDAVFGQAGARLAVDGGGRDLWKATAEFGAVYRSGALRDGGSVQVRVDAQENTSEWARAGLVIRNDLASATSPGFANLALTPGHGVVFSHDADGDGELDTYRAVAGVHAPVLLRITRKAGDWTGAFSRDNGRTWRTVATVSLPAAASAQDAGLFMTATDGGLGQRGLVEFRDLRAG
ncbi:alpha-N-acetylglucosaminidase TIM-barrel domain-containing protein [Streptomyces sulphureus]|uniref:alpha-N-acetylglucosaminidase n=1 Tax=Streptomyces sulphureus TaxID=47758 RepID=UPI000376AFFD|nr:alpha-N-acetylglucosaminidase TIM-barrel domain-containing protein [Streptomyces sulphureus]